MIVDASVLLSAFFPDEAQTKAQAIVRDHIAGKHSLKAPTLLLYELSNAVWQAERRKRITRVQADEIIQAFTGLDIELMALAWGEMLPQARQFNCSVYDASYLALAATLGEPLVTGNERLYNAVHPHLEWVSLIENYQ